MTGQPNDYRKYQAREELLSVCIHSQGFPTSLTLNQTRTKLFFFPFHFRVRGPFLESPGNFSGPKTNIQIEI